MNVEAVDACGGCGDCLACDLENMGKPMALESWQKVAWEPPPERPDGEPLRAREADDRKRYRSRRRIKMEAT